MRVSFSEWTGFSSLPLPVPAIAPSLSPCRDDSFFMSSRAKIPRSPFLLVTEHRAHQPVSIVTCEYEEILTNSYMKIRHEYFDVLIQSPARPLPLAIRQIALLVHN